MQVQHGADQGIKNYTSSNKRLRSLKFSQRWKQEKLDKKGFVIKFKVSHSVENRRSWTTSMQWRASARNGSTTGTQTCLWRRSATFVVKKRHYCCLCFVFGHNLLPGDIGLGSLSSFAWLRQEGEDGSLLSNGGVFLLVVVMSLSFYRCRSSNSIHDQFL